MSSVDGRYFEYCKTDRQAEIVQAVIDAGSQGKAAKKLDIGQRVVERALQKIRNNAKADGNLLMPLKGQSNIRRDADGKMIGWDKSQNDRSKEDFYAAMLDGLEIKKVVPTKRPTLCSEICSVLSLADSHLGMLAYSRETRGSNWNTDTATELLCLAIDSLFPTHRKIKHAVLLNLGDLMHFDGMVAKTNQSGNILDADTRFGKVARSASVVIRYAIDRMLQVADTVHVMNVRGNHDESSMLWLNILLQNVYADEPRITIPDNDSAVLTHEWGGNFIWSHHGNGVNHKRMYEGMTKEYKKEYGRAEYIWCPYGHLHNEMNQWVGGAYLECQTTLAPPDAWHSNNLYAGHREMCRTDLHPAGGRAGREYFNPALH